MLNFTFNQELHFCKREHKFIEEIVDLNSGRLFCLKRFDGSDEGDGIWGR